MGHRKIGKGRNRKRKKKQGIKVYICIYTQRNIPNEHRYIQKSTQAKSLKQIKNKHTEIHSHMNTKANIQTHNQQQPKKNRITQTHK